MHTNLAGISPRTRVTGCEKSKHPAVPAGGHVIGPGSGGNDELRTRTQTKHASRFCKQTNVNSDARIGDGVGIRAGELPQTQLWELRSNSQRATASAGKGRIEVDREVGLKPILRATPMHSDGTFQLRAIAGRVLIVLTAFLVAISPLTEYYWNFDNFLHGGQDFEFGLLATVTVLCLVLVLLQHSKQGVTLWFALRRWLSVSLPHGDPATPRLPFRLAMASYAVPLPDPKSGLCDLPLRI
jgi:hypothetical protein